MALQGCCCCCLRGGVKAVGVLFLVMTLLLLLGVIVTWAVLNRALPTNVQSFSSFSVNTSEVVDATLNLGTFGGQFSFSSDGTVSQHTPGDTRVSVSTPGDARVSVSTPDGQTSSDGRRHSSLPGQEGMSAIVQTTLICCTVFVLPALAFNSMLIHGAEHDSSGAVLAWLVFYGAVFVVMSLSSIGGLIFVAVALGSASSGDGSDGLVLGIGIGAGLGLLICALLWFWWVLVLTFYRELRDGTRGCRDVPLQRLP